MLGVSSEFKSIVPSVISQVTRSEDANHFGDFIKLQQDVCLKLLATSPRDRRTILRTSPWLLALAPALTRTCISCKVGTSVGERRRVREQRGGW